MAREIVAPYIRCEHGDTGRPQFVVRRALARAGFGQLRLARTKRAWGKGLTKQLNAWRQTVGIRNRSAVYTREDHAKLARYWDAFNQRLAHEHVALVAERTRQAKKRAQVVAACAHLYNERLRIPYSQARPYSRRWPPSSSDCSGSSGLIDERAGIRLGDQPGWGNTWSRLGWLRSNRRVIVTGHGTLERARPGDYIHYGASIDNPSHEARYLGVGRDGRTRSFQFGRYPCRIDEVDYRPDRVAVSSLFPVDT